MGAGGGATDIRVGGTSLYHRIIVAGGGSGGWCQETESDIKDQKSGYDGGGTEGAGYSSEYCGTQTRAGTGGGFGYGASVTSSPYDTISYTYAAGAGGGGWYGGGRISGGSTKKTDKDKYVNRAGGGSGYVLTSSSYKPNGYAVGSEYYMTEIRMQTGVNQGEGKAEIEFVRGVRDIYSEEKEIEIEVGNRKGIDISKIHSDIGIEIGKIVIGSANEGIARVEGTQIVGVRIGDTKVLVSDEITGTSCVIYVKVVEGKKEEIAEGKGYRIIKKRDGTVWSVGQNGAGQLGVRRQL